MRLREHRRGEVRIVIVSDRHPLAADEMRVELLADGETTWREKTLTPASWRHLGSGVYALALDPDDVGSAGELAVLVASRDDLEHAIPPRLHTFDVMPVVEAQRGRASMRTTLVGRVITLDEKPIPNAQLVVRLMQPLAIHGDFITAQPTTVQCDGDGRFEFDAPTGATLHVNIPCLPMQKQFVVPPPAAIGMPILLTSL